MGADGMTESHPLLGQTIKVRGLNQSVPITPEIVRTKLVRKDKENIGLFSCGHENVRCTLENEKDTFLRQMTMNML
jgi:hypothetical protein